MEFYTLSVWIAAEVFTRIHTYPVLSPLLWAPFIRWKKRYFSFLMKKSENHFFYEVFLFFYAYSSTLSFSLPLSLSSLLSSLPTFFLFSFIASFLPFLFPSSLSSFLSFFLLSFLDFLPYILYFLFFLLSSFLFPLSIFLPPPLGSCSYSSRTSEWSDA